MNTLRVALFGLLVAATVAAFFVAQKIKNEPSTIQSVRHATLISPNGDGRLDTIGFSLRLREADHVTLTIVDEDGDPVKVILDDRNLGAYENLDGDEVRWDGRDEDGKVVPDGRYRLRITLRDRGRTAVDDTSIRVDTRPPTPTILRVEPAPEGGGPVILPRENGGDVTAIFKKARSDASIAVYRTSPDVKLIRARDIAPGTTRWAWDGTDESGSRVPDGTYVFVARWRDKAGNFGTSVPVDREGLPLPRGSYPGKGGATVRYVSVSPPQDAVKAGTKATFGIDTRGAPYRWALRRAGGRTIKNGRADRSPLTLEIPRANAGLYQLVVTAGSHVSRGPFVVNGTRQTRGTPESPRGVLVVVPAVTWQGRNPVDDDGDGAPNLLDRGAPVRALGSDGRQTPFVGDGLPYGFGAQEQPLFAWLDRDHTYDVATDLELQSDPRLLRSYRGVILTSDARWLTREQGSRLRRFVSGGGTLLSLGTSALRRTVAFDPDSGRLTDPSRASRTDLFGAEIGRVQAQPTGLEVLGDQVGLFGRTGGAVPSVTRWEPTRAVGQLGEQQAAAVTADTDPPGQMVTIAVRVGDGLLIRPGFGTFSARLDEPDVDGVMDGAWALLSR